MLFTPMLRVLPHRFCRTGSPDVAQVLVGSGRSPRHVTPDICEWVQGLLVFNALCDRDES